LSAAAAAAANAVAGQQLSVLSAAANGYTVAT